jgi:hypothetical protein
MKLITLVQFILLILNFPCIGQEIDKYDLGELYLNKLIENVPEITEKSEEIEYLSNKEVKLKISIDLNDPENGFYLVKVFEDHNDHIVTIWWFRIHKDSYLIEYYDVIDDKYISLEKWRGIKE